MTIGTDSRRGEALHLVAALAAILVATAVVSRMLIAAWDDHGLVYHLVHGFGRTMGWGIDGVVVFAAIFVLTLVVAFALDEDKHVQGVLLLAAIAFVFVPTLLLLGRWFAGVDFTAYPIPAAAGVLLGAVVVGVGASVPPLTDSRVAFPNAARALYAVVGGVAVVGFVERYLTYRSPIVVVQNTPEIDQIASGPLTPLVDLVSVFALVYLMGYFTRYSDVTDVVISSPDDEAVTAFLGGLYDAADDRYGATSLEGGDVLNAARSQSHSLPRLTGRVAFQYRPGEGAFVRRREVAYDNLRPVSDSDVDAIESIADQRSSLGSRLWFGFRRHLRLAAPGFFRSQLRRSGGAHLDRLVGSDIILLLAPVSDLLREDLIDGGETFDESWVRDRAYLERYDDLAAACADSSMPDVYVVATDADRALDLHRADSLDSGPFLRFLRTDVLRLGDAARGHVLPVSGTVDGEGYDEVLRTL
ncbi:MAG: hypothetical protein ABEK02_01970 [Haloquadratum sp.]